MPGMVSCRTLIHGVIRDCSIGLLLISSSLMSFIHDESSVDVSDGSTAMAVDDVALDDVVLEDDCMSLCSFAFSMAFSFPINVAVLDFGEGTTDADVDDDVFDDVVANAVDAFAFACFFAMAVSGGNGDDTHML